MVKAVKKWFKNVENIRDVHVYGGAIMASVGMYMIYPPAGAILFGTFLTWLGLRAPNRQKGR